MDSQDEHIASTEDNEGVGGEGAGQSCTQDVGLSFLTLIYDPFMGQLTSVDGGLAV